MLTSARRFHGRRAAMIDAAHARSAHLAGSRGTEGINQAGKISLGEEPCWEISDPLAVYLSVPVASSYVPRGALARSGKWPAEVK